MKIAICDDEASFCDRLSELIRKEDEAAEISVFTSSKELLGSAEALDLVFLDIRMPEPNGIETAKRLRAKDAGVCIIFVSSAKEYVFDAFDVSAFHYLVKPVDESKFAAVYRRARKASEKSRHPSPLTITTRQESYVVKPSEILYAESRVKKIVLHTAYDSIAYYGNLGKLEKRLGDPFFRCHRGYLVNLAYVRSYGTDHIKLSDGSSIYMAKIRYEDFQTAYMEFVKAGGNVYG